MIFTFKGTLLQACKAVENFAENLSALAVCLRMCFEKAKDNGESVVVITVSSALSGSYQSAVLARDLLGYEGCYVIDSKSASAGQKLLVNEALRLRDNGFTAKEIAEHLLRFRSKLWYMPVLTI